MQTNIQESVITLFKQIGYEKNQHISQLTARRALDQRSKAVEDMPFKLAMADDIISQCTNQRQQITPERADHAFEQAYLILKNRIILLNTPKGLIPNCIQAIQRNKQILQASNSTSNYQIINTQIKQQIQCLEGQLKELEANRIIFQEELQIIERMFIHHNADYKRRDETELEKTSYSKYLSFMFYLASLGLLLQFVIVQLRPGWLSMLIYFQVHFLLLVGYYNKNATQVLVVTNFFSLLTDGIALFLFQFLNMIGVIDWQANKIKPITLVILKFLLFLSIFFRITILLFSCKFIKPPFVKTYFKIFGKTLQLNTRIQLFIKNELNQNIM